MSSLSFVIPTVPTVYFQNPLVGTKQVYQREKMKILGSGLAVPFRPPLRNKKKAAVPHIQHCSSRKVTCMFALNATCATEQQTIQHQSSVITNAPIQGKEKSPELDDGGTGFPPRDDGDGGGGGGGGGGGWTGGFFFFGFLAFLGLLKDKESEGPYGDERSR